MRQFETWLDDAQAAEVRDPTAMTLATADRDGTPSARIVLLKGVGPRGFTFFTSSVSRKARELALNPRAALVFFWRELDRQVRVAGRVAPVPREEAEAYFRQRPTDSQLGAWASAQSSVVPDRKALDDRFEALEAQYADGAIPVPPFWGGYCLSPGSIEFWQGRPARMHDRLRYRKRDDGTWRMERLSP